MPSTIKIRVIEARELPVMDRTSNLTDAFVDVRFSNNAYQTSIVRKTLNPVWKEDTRFDVADDSELQNEPLVFRVMDHDVYSADDLIGTVYIGLGPLLQMAADGDDGQESPNKFDEDQIDGWFPIYDTLNGIRGELHVIVKVRFYDDVNPFKESSAGVRFFATSVLESSVLRIDSVLGFVEELVVDSDPEYEWNDNFRTARKSNESRQGLLYRLSNQVRRQIGKKILELGGNSVVGYQQNFDVEGDSGLVARASGTACIISENRGDAGLVVIKPSNPNLPVPLEASFGYTAPPNVVVPLANLPQTYQAGNIPPVSYPQNAYIHVPVILGVKSSTRVTRSNSLENLDSVVTGPNEADDSQLDTEKDQLASFIRKMPGLEQEIVLLTINVLPMNVCVRLGGIVASRSVKFLGRLAAKIADQETRDQWWEEIRDEIRSHARSLHCQHVIGYKERCVIHDDVCVLSAMGTAAVVLSDRPVWTVMNLPERKTAPEPETAGNGEAENKDDDPLEGKERANKDLFVVELPLPGALDDRNAPDMDGAKYKKKKAGRFKSVSSPGKDGTRTQWTAQPPSHTGGKPILPCSIVHVPYRHDAAPFANMRLVPCGLCRKKWVPDVLLSTIDPPSTLPVTGSGVLIEARACRSRPKVNSKADSREADASVVSEILVFLEIEMHKQLMLKLKILGMNAAFAVRSQVHIGSCLVAGVTTATAIHTPALPPPAILRIHRSIEVEDQEDIDLITLQHRIERVAAANRERMLKASVVQATAYRKVIKRTRHAEVTAKKRYARIQKQQKLLRKKRRREKRKYRKNKKLMKRKRSPRSRDEPLNIQTVSFAPVPITLNTNVHSLEEESGVSGETGSEARGEKVVTPETGRASPAEGKTKKHISVLDRLIRRKEKEKQLGTLANESGAGHVDGETVSKSQGSELSVWQRLRAKTRELSNSSTQDLANTSPRKKRESLISTGEDAFLKFRKRHNSDSTLVQSPGSAGGRYDFMTTDAPEVPKEGPPVDQKDAKVRRRGKAVDKKHSRLFISKLRRGQNNEHKKDKKRDSILSHTENETRDSDCKSAYEYGGDDEAEDLEQRAQVENEMQDSDAKPTPFGYGGDDEAEHAEQCAAKGDVSPLVDSSMRRRRSSATKPHFKTRQMHSGRKSSVTRKRSIDSEMGQTTTPSNSSSSSSSTDTSTSGSDDDDGSNTSASFGDSSKSRSSSSSSSDSGISFSSSSSEDEGTHIESKFSKHMLDEIHRSKKTFVIEVDDETDEDIMTVLLDKQPPLGVYFCNTEVLPQTGPFVKSMKKEQMITLMTRQRLDESRPTRLNTQFSSLFHELYAMLVMKLVSFAPCVVCGIRIDLTTPAEYVVEVLLTATVHRIILQDSEASIPAEILLFGEQGSLDQPMSSRLGGLLKQKDVHRSGMACVVPTAIESLIFDTFTQRFQMLKPISPRSHSLSTGSDAIAALTDLKKSHYEEFSKMLADHEAIQMNHESFNRGAHEPPGVLHITDGAEIETANVPPPTKKSGLSYLSSIKRHLYVPLPSLPSLPFRKSSSTIQEPNRFKQRHSTMQLDRVNSVEMENLKDSVPASLRPSDVLLDPLLSHVQLSPDVIRTPRVPYCPIVEVTPLSFVPGYHVTRYLGRINLHFIRESWAVREGAGLGLFFHEFLNDAQAIARAHVVALNGNALLSFKLTPRESSGKALKSVYNMISLSGDVAVIQK
uniref:C2 domain-containing protein n=1 Tax=Mucochytrium quahogii TaxID=96639 RepID=A0A7S2W4C5_9STRA|mmetsp:Transcript_38443/g.62222  ORF Transcript_38443/g.62222 Transcript_38443/m.62222 type:complete len:1703 (+) Transcript_38443:2906-8014(+)